MLDQTTDVLALPAKASEIRPLFAPGDIVLFRFPVEGGALLPKLRPCLVLDVELRGEHGFVSLAYGTDTRHNSNRGYDICVNHAEDARRFGLAKPTRFVGARRILVSAHRLRPPFVIGRLDGAVLERLHAVRARIQAEADIATEARTRHLRDITLPDRNRMTSRKITVERRHPAPKRLTR